MDYASITNFQNPLKLERNLKNRTIISRRPTSNKSQAFHRHLSKKNADSLQENRSGYNGYFLT